MRSFSCARARQCEREENTTSFKLLSLSCPDFFSLTRKGSTSSVAVRARCQEQSSPESAYRERTQTSLQMLVQCVASYYNASNWSTSHPHALPASMTESGYDHIVCREFRCRTRNRITRIPDPC